MHSIPAGISFPFIFVEPIDNAFDIDHPKKKKQIRNERAGIKMETSREEPLTGFCIRLPCDLIGRPSFLPRPQKIEGSRGKKKAFDWRNIVAGRIKNGIERGSTATDTTQKKLF